MLQIHYNLALSLQEQDGFALNFKERQITNIMSLLLRLLAADAQPKNLSLSQDLSSNPTNMQKIQDLELLSLLAMYLVGLLQEDCSRLCS